MGARNKPKANPSSNATQTTDEATSNPSQLAHVAHDPVPRHLQLNFHIMLYNILYETTLYHTVSCYTTRKPVFSESFLATLTSRLLCTWGIVEAICKGKKYHWGTQGLKFNLLKGSWDLVSMVISTLIGVIRYYKYTYPSNNPSY